MSGSAVDMKRSLLAKPSFETDLEDEAARADSARDQAACAEGRLPAPAAAPDPRAAEYDPDARGDSEPTPAGRYWCAEQQLSLVVQTLPELHVEVWRCDPAGRPESLALAGGGAVEARLLTASVRAAAGGPPLRLTALCDGLVLSARLAPAGPDAPPPPFAAAAFRLVPPPGALPLRPPCTLVTAYPPRSVTLTELSLVATGEFAASGPGPVRVRGHLCPYTGALNVSLEDPAPAATPRELPPAFFTGARFYGGSWSLHAAGVYCERGHAALAALLDEVAAAADDSDESDDDSDGEGGAGPAPPSSTPPRIRPPARILQLAAEGPLWSALGCASSEALRGAMNERWGAPHPAAVPPLEAPGALLVPPESALARAFRSGPAPPAVLRALQLAGASARVLDGPLAWPALCRPLDAAREGDRALAADLLRGLLHAAPPSKGELDFLYPWDASAAAGHTPLVRAVLFLPEAAEDLVAVGADAAQAANGAGGRSAFSFACQFNAPLALRLLRSLPEGAEARGDAAGRPPLFYAVAPEGEEGAAAGEQEAVRVRRKQMALLKELAGRRAGVGAVDAAGRNVLHFAFERGAEAEDVRTLAAALSPPHSFAALLAARDGRGRTAASLLLPAGEPPGDFPHVELFKAAVQAGAALPLEGTGQTPGRLLAAFLLRGDREIATVRLLMAGLDRAEAEAAACEAGPDGRSALDVALADYQLGGWHRAQAAALVRLLLGAGAQLRRPEALTRPDPATDRTALMAAVEGGDDAFIRAAVAALQGATAEVRRAASNARTAAGLSALALAVQAGPPPGLPERAAAAAASIRSMSVASAEEAAGEGPEAPGVEWLAAPESEVDVNGRDGRGLTPLHVACSLADLEWIQLLRTHPLLDESARDDAGWTPYMHAAYSGQSAPRIAALLEAISHGKEGLGSGTASADPSGLTLYHVLGWRGSPSLAKVPCNGRLEWWFYENGPRYEELRRIVKDTDNRRTAPLTVGERVRLFAAIFGPATPYEALAHLSRYPVHAAVSFACEFKRRAGAAGLSASARARWRDACDGAIALAVREVERLDSIGALPDSIEALGPRNARRTVLHLAMKVGADAGPLLEHRRIQELQSKAWIGEAAAAEASVLYVVRAALLDRPLAAVAGRLRRLRDEWARPAGAEGVVADAVRVQLAGVATLSLAEVEARVEPAALPAEELRALTAKAAAGAARKEERRENVARGKPCAQSSVDAGGVPERANNGRYDAESLTCTKREWRPWWRVEWKGEREVTAVDLWNRPNDHQEWLANVDVVLFRDGDEVARRHWRHKVQRRIHFSFAAAGPSASAPPSALQMSASGHGRRGVIADSCMVQIQGHGVLSMAEVEVWSPVPREPGAGAGAGASGGAADAPRPAVPSPPAPIAKLVNVAVGKRCTQSSTEGGAGPERAADGLRDGEFHHGTVTATKREWKPWWQVDLGKPHVVREVAVFNRTDFIPERQPELSVSLLRRGHEVARQSAGAVAAERVVKLQFAEDAVRPAGLLQSLRLPATSFALEFLFYCVFIGVFSAVLARQEAGVNAAECILLSIVAGFIAEEVRQAWGDWADYVASMWNMLDMLNIVLFVAFFALRAYTLHAGTRAVSVPLGPERLEFTPFAVLSFNSIFLWLHLLVVCELDARLGPLLMIVRGSLADLALFVVILACALVAFAQTLFGLLIARESLGPESAHSSFSAMSFLVFRCLLGDFDLSAVGEIVPFWGPALCSVFLVLCVVMLLNLLIARFSATYEAVSERAEYQFLLSRAETFLRYREAAYVPPPFNLLAHLWAAVSCLRPGRPDGPDPVPSVQKGSPEDFDIAHRRSRAALLVRPLPSQYEEMVARRNAQAAEAGGSVSGAHEAARALERLLRDAEARIVEGVARELAARGLAQQ